MRLRLQRSHESASPGSVRPIRSPRVPPPIDGRQASRKAQGHESLIVRSWRPAAPRRSREIRELGRAATGAERRLPSVEPAEGTAAHPPACQLNLLVARQRLDHESCCLGECRLSLRATNVANRLKSTLVTTGAHHGWRPARPRRMASVSRKMPRHVGQRHAPPRPRRPIGSMTVPSLGHAHPVVVWSVTTCTSSELMSPTPWRPTSVSGDWGRDLEFSPACAGPPVCQTPARSRKGRSARRATRHPGRGPEHQRSRHPGLGGQSRSSAIERDPPREADHLGSGPCPDS